MKIINENYNKNKFLYKKYCCFLFWIETMTASVGKSDKPVARK